MSVFLIQSLLKRSSNVDSVNLKDILTGKSNELPDDLTIDERYTFVRDLATALYRLQATGEYANSEWDKITDCYLRILMDKFSIEMQIVSFIHALRVHRVNFNSETDVFTEFYETVSPWIVSDHLPRVYDGNNSYISYDEYSKKPQPKDQVGGHGCGGSFTLKDHHKNQ